MMIRSTLLVLAILGTAATALASASGHINVFGPSKPVSAIMVDMEQGHHPLVLEKCAVEDCSDTPNS